MDTQGKLPGFVERWRKARLEAKHSKTAWRDQRDAEELQMVKDGLTRRPGISGP